MTKIIAAIEQWGAEFEEKYIYNRRPGRLFPKVNIGAIEGGAPYRPNYFPGVCSIYVDIRMPPQVRPVTIKHEMEQALKSLGVDYELDFYKSLLGHDGKNVEPLVQSAEEIYQHLFGEKIKAGIARPRQHLDRYQHLQRARHPCDQDRPARPAHLARGTRRSRST